MANISLYIVMLSKQSRSGHYALHTKKENVTEISLTMASGTS